MKKLNDYIKIINENEEEKAQKYEKLIGKAFQHISKKEQIEQFKIIEDFETKQLINSDESFFNEQDSKKYIDNFLEKKELTDHIKAYLLAKKILKILNKNNALIKVEIIGSNKVSITNYWRNLYIKEKGEKEQKESSGKTDIFLDINGKKYKLSLKMGNDAQSASPYITDIYILSMHGINQFLKKYKYKIIKYIKDGTDEKENKLKEYLNNIDNNNEINIDFRKSMLETLKKEIYLSNTKTKAYASVLNAAITLEILIKGVGGDIKEKLEKINEFNNNKDDIRNKVMTELSSILNNNEIKNEINSKPQKQIEQEDEIIDQAVEIKKVTSIVQSFVNTENLKIPENGDDGNDAKKLLSEFIHTLKSTNQSGRFSNIKDNPVKTPAAT